MGMREILKGTVIYESGQKLNGLMMIMRGTAGDKFPICGEGESGSCGLSIKGVGAEEVFQGAW